MLNTIINLTAISEKINYSYLLENNLWRGVHNLDLIYLFIFNQLCSISNELKLNHTLSLKQVKAAWEKNLGERGFANDYTNLLAIRSIS